MSKTYQCTNLRKFSRIYMQVQLNNLKERSLARIHQAESREDIEGLRVKILGRKGELTILLQGLPGLGDDERRSMGVLANQVKDQITHAIEARKRELLADRFSNLAETERIDVTLPGHPPPQGHLHLVTQAIREIAEIFEHMEFTRARYPEVEWDYFAFEALNMPSDHPARDEWETFFVGDEQGTQIRHPKLGKMVLTPHTSNGQVREMLRGELPIRMVNISTTYRRQVDVTHTPMFHQIEGLLIDRGVALTHLKGVASAFVKAYFGVDREIRLRPHHFQFTEPSFEVDVSCGLCGGTGTTRGAVCRMCKSGWVELAGAGMVHPNVLRAGRIDPKKYSGFAFGFGIERALMMKSGLKIPDMRMLYENDLRFLTQF